MIYYYGVSPWSILCRRDAGLMVMTMSVSLIHSIGRRQKAFKILVANVRVFCTYYKTTFYLHRIFWVYLFN